MEFGSLHVRWPERRHALSAWFAGWLVVSMVAAAESPSLSLTVPSAKLELYSATQSPLPIVLPAAAAPAERLAAEELARVLRRMSNRDVAIVAEGGALESGILLGRVARSAQFAPPLREARDWFQRGAGEVGPDAFRLAVRGRWLVIEGATPEALPFAVSWLVQQHAGVRWFFPGAAGETIPPRDAWSLPATLLVEREPAYVSREFHLGAGEAEAQWALRNGLRARLEFNHALNGVFSAADFAAHPEWMGEVRGERRPPRSPDDYHWQPDLAAQEVARVAGERAARALLADPARRSFSLGMNDTVRFDQGAATRARVEPLRWFRGMPDYSALIFTFMNRAAAALDERPELDGRYLGCLAYFWAENVPEFAVHPRVIPYVTTDRAQFFDATFRREDADLLVRWGRSGVRTFGVWDYAYGHGFLVPREPLAAHREGIRAGWAAGARGYFADATPDWGFDAFKLWSMARLLWEPQLTDEALAAEFFQECYGPAASPMRKFFERCEAAWMAQTGSASWLKLHQHEDQALIFSETLGAELRGGLEEARLAARDSPAFAARVQLTTDSWRRTEAFLTFDRKRRELTALSLETGRADSRTSPASPPASSSLSRMASLPPSAVRLAQDLVALEAARARFLVEAADSRTSTSWFVRNDPVPRLLAELGWRDGSLARRVLEAVTPDGAAAPRWMRLAQEFEGGRLTGAKNLARNGDFETAAPQGQEPKFLFPHSGELPAEWELRAVATEKQRVVLLPADGRRPRRTLRIEGAWDTQVFQWNAATPGVFHVATVRARAVSSAGSDAGLFLTFLDAAGKLVGEHRVQTLAHSTNATWTNLVLADFAPATAAWVGVGIAASRQAPGDWFETGGVELRECAAEAAEPAQSAQPVAAAINPAP